jgi:protein TonB
MPRLEIGPRAAPAAAVAAIHAALVVGLLLLPPVRERLALPLPIVVSLIEARRELPPEVKPPRPMLREAPRVDVPIPPIAIAPEIVVAPPPEPRPTITGPIAPAPAVPERVAQAIEPPRFDMSYLRNPPPTYPSTSRRMREQGRVLLSVLVSANGEAETIEVRTSSGSDRLDRAAMDAVRRWRFAPARRGAQAIAGWALVPILFQLES